MLVILRENVENLGHIGDVVKVSDGYARNFLLPRNLVVVAEAKNVAAIEHQKKLLEKKRLAQQAVAKEVAQKLEQVTCTISRKVGEHDKLFGSVSASDIAAALKVAGYQVEKRSISLNAPIRTLGLHTVTVKLDAEVSTNLKVQVSKED
ncbi:50S ribosomal protein L9 [bacterium]|nr:50S ribosomal protein L9 [bacterium]